MIRRMASWKERPRTWTKKPIVLPANRAGASASSFLLCSSLGRLVSLEELPPAFGVEGDSEHQLSEILRDALATLMPEERELLQAAYVDERPLQELAEASGLTYKAVESRLARLRQKLKKHLLKNLRHEYEP